MDCPVSCVTSSPASRMQPVRMSARNNIKITKGFLLTGRSLLKGIIWNRGLRNR